ncbi:mannitol dehydrogenase family protein [Granulicoccus phenolivorans]|uniref:mannitol dehydrogenase family protein n=1 Tax=Granulicoccus phenolivorans TaxID=266854 RepID=UPI0003F8A0C2|nr:mannitol dehydrogenase family protein [Granulicoccus phenolivorans]
MSSANSEAPRLSRSLPGMPPAAPVRIVHVGLGNFHRAHQAYYTCHAADAAQWGIASFCGRHRDQADALAPQDGLYTLIVQGADGNRPEVIGAISEARGAEEIDRWLELLSSPEVVILTSTVTEKGYAVAKGALDLSDELVVRDLATLRAGSTGPLETYAGKVVAGLQARRAAGVGGLTVLPCDNLSNNGGVARAAIRGFAEAYDPDLLAWIDEVVVFASSMVDRITPATTDENRAQVLAESGYVDAWPVPTEPFIEWVIEGEFPHGRPDWESSGATVITEGLEVFETRKLWLLNGSHSMMAYAGPIRGRETVAEAIADPVIRGWVETFWDEAGRHLALPPADIAAYRSALLERFANPNIRHLLAQIAHDGSIKLAQRTVPVAKAERAEGKLPLGCATTLAAWVLHLRGTGAPVVDAHAEAALQAAATTDDTAAVRGVLATLDADLAADDEFVAAVVGRLAVVAGS